MEQAEHEEAISNVHTQTKQLFFTQQFHVALLLENGACDGEKPFDGGVETR